jgi:acetyl esterase
MDIFDPDEAVIGQPGSLVMFFHGGGWIGGSPEQFHPQCTALARLGVVAVSVEYRVTERHGSTPDLSLSDAKSAIRWIRERADDLNINPERVVAAGASAGGQLAAAMAMISGFDDKDDDYSIDCRPNALVLFNPVIDNGPGGYGHLRVSDYWSSFSPYHNVGTDIPPSLILTGENDQLIPVERLRLFQEKVRLAGTICELKVFPGQPHGFFNKERSVAMYEKTLREMILFLRNLGFLSSVS